MKYNSVIISGLPGAGKGVLSKAIAEKHGWKLFSVGEIWRRKWLENHPDKKVPFESFWKEISFEEQKEANDIAREIVSKGNVVGDFRYAICCKDIPALFIFLKSDIEIRSERAILTGRYKEKTKEEIKEILIRREKDELNWGKKLFGEDYDYTDSRFYDLVIDSGKFNLEEEIKIIEAILNQ